MNTTDLAGIVPARAPLPGEQDRGGDAGRYARWQSPDRSTLRSLRTARNAARRVAEARRTLQRRVARCSDAAEAIRLRALALSRVGSRRALTIFGT